MMALGTKMNVGKLRKKNKKAIESFRRSREAPPIHPPGSYDITEDVIIR